MELIQKSLVLSGSHQHLLGSPLPAQENADFQRDFCPGIKSAEMAFCFSFAVNFSVALWLQDMRALTSEGEAVTWSWKMQPCRPAAIAVSVVC